MAQLDANPAWVVDHETVHREETMIFSARESTHRVAAERLFARNGITDPPRQIDVLEMYDPSAWWGLDWLGDFMLCDGDEHLRMVENDDIAMDGEDTTMLAPGILRFTLNGAEQTLEPYQDSPDDDSYFLIFRDGTSAVTTYGAGRFLYADVAGADATTVLDFNLAYNPPCAFTPYATCPLPPPQNWLQASINAGEMYVGEEH